MKLFGEMVTRRAEIETISGYSAHADRTELAAWVKALGGPIRRAFVVHGEPDAAEAMAAILRRSGVGEVTIPTLGESFQL
jgi:metallo-beta-lactamase family protein